jgi:hypothetical protein
MPLRSLGVELKAGDNGSLGFQTDQQTGDVEVHRVGVQLQRALVGLPAALRVGKKLQDTDVVDDPAYRQFFPGGVDDDGADAHEVAADAFSPRGSWRRSGER